MAHTKTQNLTINTVYRRLSLIAAIALIVISALALWANRFTTQMVQSELSAQKIYFPEEGSPALDPAVYPDLQKYAGQLVDTPEEAKAYANGYIGRHLDKIADGKVYSEVSTAAMKDPTNQALQQQKQTLFQGETLRGILLSSGYAFGTVGKLAGYASALTFIGAILMFILAAKFNQKK